ncbi:MAG TPA: enoyl-CoA hydratase-related protein [Acidisphaera sp.]|nr:enoyl-CoA hydratase-related protein [Acidisphaera sp.]
MAYETLLVSQDGPVAHIRLNRPDKRNSLTPAFWREFPDAIAELDAPGTVRALILSGEGPSFCAGMDLSVFASGLSFRMDSARARSAMIETGRALLRGVAALEAARFPTIAVVHGACLGAGLEIAAACDLRFVTADAQLRIEEINIGLMADLGALQRVPRLMPQAIARELAYTGATLTGARAAEIGFANAALPDVGAAMARAQEAAQAIAMRSPLAVRASKDALNYARDHAIADALDRAMVMNGAVMDPGEMAESMAARSERRSPHYADLPPLPGPGGLATARKSG